MITAGQCPVDIATNKISVACQNSTKFTDVKRAKNVPYVPSFFAQSRYENGSTEKKKQTIFFHREKNNIFILGTVPSPL